MGRLGTLSGIYWCEDGMGKFFVRMWFDYGMGACLGSRWVDRWHGFIVKAQLDGWMAWVHRQASSGWMDCMGTSSGIIWLDDGMGTSSGIIWLDDGLGTSAGISCVYGVHGYSFSSHSVGCGASSARVVCLAGSSLRLPPRPRPVCCIASLIRTPYTR